jgi:hypothetical protein
MGGAEIPKLDACISFGPGEKEMFSPRLEEG